MYKILLSIYLLFIAFHLSASDVVRGMVSDEKKEALAGASVHWKNTSMGVVTNEKGTFSLPVSSTTNELEISFVGYSSVTITIEDPSKYLLIQLLPNLELKEVVVAGQIASTISSRITPLQTQKITYNELCRAACCNLAESFETNPSVDVSYSDAATGAKQIRLLGLSGAYVQMLTENFPNFKGLAAPYGLDYIPGPWMESILVSKGTSSVKNGYEAMTGQINVEYKKPPTSDIISANLFAADNGRYEANTDASILLNEQLSTGLFIHYSNEEKEFDMNDDGFLDSPLKRQFNIMNRWHYRNEKMVSQSGVKFLKEDRRGGQTGNTRPDGNAASLYKTNTNTDRFELFTKNGIFLNAEKNESAALILSGSYHDQESLFGRRFYNAAQTNLYASLMYETDLAPGHRISTGASVNHDAFDETYNLFYVDPNVLYVDLPGDETKKTKETTAGVYAEYTYNKDDKLIILAGLRADYSSLCDFFVTPRLHLKYNFADWVHARASIGKGFRTTYLLPENSFYLASSRLLNPASQTAREEAWNYGVNLSFYLPIAGKELTINGEWYYTNFLKQLVADVDTDPHIVSFYNLDGKSYSSSVQLEATYPFFRGFTLTAAYRTMDVKTTYNGVLRNKPLTNKYKALVTASYQTPLRKWQFDFTSQFNGGGRMPDPDPTNPLWEDTFESHILLSGQITKFFRTWSVYAGAENLLDYMQMHPVIASEDPWGKHFDATMIWGPLHGRKIYIGARWNLPRL